MDVIKYIIFDLPVEIIELILTKGDLRGASSFIQTSSYFYTTYKNFVYFLREKSQFLSNKIFTDFTGILYQNFTSNHSTTLRTREYFRDKFQPNITKIEHCNLEDYYLTKGGDFIHHFFNRECKSSSRKIAENVSDFVFYTDICYYITFDGQIRYSHINSIPIFKKLETRFPGAKLKLCISNLIILHEGKIFIFVMYQNSKLFSSIMKFRDINIEDKLWSTSLTDVKDIIPCGPSSIGYYFYYINNNDELYRFDGYHIASNIKKITNYNLCLYYLTNSNVLHIHINNETKSFSGVSDMTFRYVLTINGKCVRVSDIL